MATAELRQSWAFDEFCAVIPDGQKADLIDGVIYMASPDSVEANKVTGFVYRLVADYTDELDLGEVFFERVALRIGDRSGPEPDVCFVRKSRLRFIHYGYIKGKANVAIEVVSRESFERDYGNKRDLYERAGVDEYWIIDMVQKKTLFLRLGKDGRYREVKLKAGVFHSRALPGFWLREEWLMQWPLPKKAKVLREILGSRLK